MLLGSFLSAPLASAQQFLLDVGKPDFDVLPSPDVGGNTGEKTFRPKDWLEAEVEFTVEKSSDDSVKFADKVTVRWFVAVENPDGKGHILLKKEVDHINVPIGEPVYSSVYLSPMSIIRLTGSDNAGKSLVESVGGEILINGAAPVKNSGFFSSKGKPGWWTKGGLSAFASVPLLSKNETPFKLLWWDRYAEIEDRK